jgi:hypothetical protein
VQLDEVEDRVHSEGPMLRPATRGPFCVFRAHVIFAEAAQPANTPLTTGAIM